MFKDTGIKAEYVTSNHGNKSDIIEMAQKGELRLLYLTPEMCSMAINFMEQLKPCR
jgi:superfamily II DNA helicase RecQ